MPLTVIGIRRFLFHWSLRLKLDIFRFVLARSFENLCRYDWLLWTFITRAGHATQWRHSCICPLIDNRHRPITARVESQLLYNSLWRTDTIVFSQLNKPPPPHPLLNKPHPHSNGLEINKTQGGLIQDLQYSYKFSGLKNREYIFWRCFLGFVAMYLSVN